MSDTPRTDHAFTIGRFNTQDRSMDFARDLERELATAKIQRDEQGVRADFADLATDKALAKLATAKAALERLRDCDWVITPHDRMDAVRTIAREALAAIK